MAYQLWATIMSDGGSIEVNYGGSILTANINTASNSVDNVTASNLTITIASVSGYQLNSARVFVQNDNGTTTKSLNLSEGTTNFSLGNYYATANSVSVQASFERSGGTVDPDPEPDPGDGDNEFYYRCEAILPSGYFRTIKSKTTTTKTSITRPIISGYNYLGYVYHTSFQNCLDQVSDNTGDDRFDGTDSTCTPPSSGKYSYIIFFYEEEEKKWTYTDATSTAIISLTSTTAPSNRKINITLASYQIKGKNIQLNKDKSDRRAKIALYHNDSSNYAPTDSLFIWGTKQASMAGGLNENSATAQNAISSGYYDFSRSVIYNKGGDAVSGDANYKVPDFDLLNSIGIYAAFNSLTHDLSDTVKLSVYYSPYRFINLYQNISSTDTTYKIETAIPNSAVETPSFTLPSSSYFTRNGYTLTGWNTAADGLGTPYSCGQTLTNITSDLTLYAQWKLNKYTVRFCNNGGTILSTLTCDPGSSITMAAATTAPAVNVEQLGWSTTNSTNYRNYNASLNSGERRCGATYTPTASLTIFYPIWKYKKQSIFYKDGPTESLAASQNMGIPTTFKATKSLLDKYICPTENEKFPFTKIVGNRTKNMRYRFTGWSPNENDKKPVYQANDDITLPTNSANLYDEKIYLYSVRQPYFYFQDAKGNNLIDAYNGPIKDFITTSQMEELRGYLNDYGIKLSISDGSLGAIGDFTSMLPDSKIKLSDYNLLGSKVENTKFTAKDFYELQQAFNSTREDKLEPWYLQPLTFTPVNASDTITITIKKIGDFSSSGFTLYRTKLSNETSYTPWPNFPVKSFTLTNKTSLSIAATSSATKLSVDSSNYYQFEITGGPVIVTGSVLSLLCQPVDYQLPDYCFYNLFKDCTNIITAPELPSLKVGIGSYQGMFQGCTGLTIPPSLPATTLGNNCYSNMFQGCTSLKLAPNLPATTLNSNCYVSMFNGCTSLKIAPKLSATTLENNSYLYMFFNCSSLEDAPFIGATTLNGTNEFGAMFNHCINLKHIKLTYTDNFSDSHFTGWVNDIAPNGILEYDGKDTTVGVDAIPSGWTVQKSI